jgi:hypothetical protein
VSLSSPFAYVFSNSSVGRAETLAGQAGQAGWKLCVFVITI